MKRIIEVIVSRCLGCHTCELECALAHSGSDTFIEAVQSEEKLYPRIILEVDGDDTIPIHCRHCADAPCITVCPTSAMKRNGPEDPVLLIAEDCIGCKACVRVCPFGVLKVVPGEKWLTKCDLCAERLEEGHNPACVESCPTGAIRFTTVEELSSERRKEAVRKFRVSMIQSDKLKE